MTTTLDVAQRFRNDEMTLGAYVSDASIFRRRPRAVFEPDSMADIREAVAYAGEQNWPVTVRGGGTSVAGNAIGDGLIIDLSRNFNRVIEINPQARTARIQPGIVCDDLREAAAEFGLTYGPDPSTHNRATVGGMIANNACGSHSLAWGTAAQNVVELTVLRPDGRPVTLFKGGTTDPDLDAELHALVDANLARLRTELGRFPRQVSGYGLHYLLPENGFDVAKAFAGSEGTLGIIVEAVVRLVEVPAAKALAVLAFPTVFDAAAAAPLTRAPGVATSEGMGGDLLDVLKISQGEHAGDILPGGTAEVPGGDRPAGGWLYCETTGVTAAEADRRARDLVARFSGGDSGIVASTIVTDPTEMRALWKIRESAAGLVTRLPDGGAAWPNWEDSAVPPENLADYLRELYRLLDTHGLRGIPFGHFGEGCVHIRISFDLGTPAGVEVFNAFMHDAAATIGRLGGSLSGEHGDGRARSALLPAMYSADMLALFAGFKAMFDPDGSLNPGVLVDPEPVTQGIRPGPGGRTREFIPLHALSRDQGSIVNAVNRCVGVGSCRSMDGAMCPSFQITHDEVHSTRGRARVLSELFRGETYPDGVKSEQVKDALDLCLSCHACASECPVNVDMSTYKSEFLNQHFSGRMRPMSHYSMGWLPWTSNILHKIPGLASLVSAAMSVRPIEWTVMKLGGVDASRSMVRFAPRSFQSWAKRAGRRAARPQPAGQPAGRGTRSGTSASHSGSGRIVLWPDSFTNHLEAGVAQDAYTVLTALGYEVIVPQGFVCCGLTWHSTGQLTQAQRVITQTYDRLGDLVDGRTPVVVLEPSCASMLAEEAPELLADDPRSARLAGQIRTLGEVVAEHVGKDSWPFGELPVPALSQVHCHERSRRAHGGTAEVLNALGVDEAEIQTGCCGLAGNWGFEPGHADMSRELGERELLPRVRELESSSMVLADGYSCRTQIREGVAGTEHQDKQGMHLAQVLRRALGPQS
ncbi:FAD-binding oxidoreductase [Brevibacterium sp. 50QC2O2]|uniref:FAD-binding and (Fe-S)-binding domain-containing protein n=1 Tax=unclassified Brevibacterium TaxID=2614124 RepID=UPI00211D1114|nr:MULTISPECIES: FAD-binding and (Fe-S)-binding domain-containing protein [unclassified Brevibacterium]MCQ9367276.1 FAD-binding oxidoreductase [Brevibacterium sp. 91QC2O2]MCQ9389756.1 FAD-binding oxidoreductase [Brevibacterium sp. 50QC2O2]